MSYFSDALQRLMQAKGLKYADISRTTGIDQATISRWINGQQKTISDEDLAKLCTVVSSDPREQASLVAARMRDVQTGPGSKLIKLTIADELLVEESPPPYGRKLPAKLADSMRNIADNVETDADLKDMVLALGKMYAPDNPRRKKK